MQVIGEAFMMARSRLQEFEYELLVIFRLRRPPLTSFVGRNSSGISLLAQKSHRKIHVVLTRNLQLNFIDASDLFSKFLVEFES
jgi:hypothetical protein